MVARLCIAHLVWMEISKLHYLAHYPSVGAEGLFALPQKDRRSKALFRSHIVAALDNVSAILWADCGFAFRHARGTAGFKQIRRSLPRPRSRRHRSIIKPLSPQRPFEVRARFPSRSKRTACRDGEERTRERSL